MKLPTIIEADIIINEAEQHNPGAWIGHSKTAAFCARAIAKRCDNLTPIPPISSDCCTTSAGVRV